MARFTLGQVTIEIPDDLLIPEKAGNLTPKEVQRVPRARSGVGLVCESVADMMQRHPGRIAVPGVDADALRKAGRQADAYEPLITDVELALLVLKQGNLLADGEAHELLRRVINALRAQEKFDPALSTLLQSLIEYFARAEAPAPG
jgi:hypothetical protein